jgi:tripartite-type tricarboxylate transporter receptor subunit TctC
MTADQIAFWRDLLRRAAGTTQWQADLTRYFWTEMHLDGAALADYLRRERGEMRAILGELGLLSGHTR